MKTIVVLGADRVGKSTLVKSCWQEQANNSMKTWEYFHFSGVKPCHNTPIEQFLEPLPNLRPAELDFLFCDRFVQDMLFYENYRKQTGSHTHELGDMVHSAYDQISSGGILYILFDCSNKRDMRLRHRQELLSLYPGASSWWLDRVIDLRMREHEAYNRFVFEYFDQRDLKLHYLEEYSYDLLDLAEWPVKDS